MALTKAQRIAIDLAFSRINPKDPGFRASEEVRAALSGDARLYLETWVYPLLASVLDGEQWYGQNRYAATDYHHVTKARAAAKVAK